MGWKGWHQCAPVYHCLQSACQGFTLASRVLANPTLKIMVPCQTSFGCYFFIDPALSFLYFWQSTARHKAKQIDSYRDCKPGRNSVVCKFNMGVWWFISSLLHLYVCIMYVCMWVGACVLLWVRAHEWVVGRVGGRRQEDVRLFTCVCVCVCVCVWERERERERDWRKILILTVQIVKISVPPSMFVQQGLNIGM